MSRPPREAQVRSEFKRSVAKHVIDVKLDNGPYRHIRFKSPGTISCYFDLVCWPGYLCFTGDMGTFVFARLTDMFEFFRQKESATIDYRYWAEKCEAADRASGLKEFSEDLFREAVRSDLDGMEACKELREEVEDSVLSMAGEGEHEAIRAAMEFTWENKRVFQDFYEHSVRDYTYRFYWACMAIVWGIARYDEAKTGAVMAEGGG